jgi:hypothetical protein
MGVQPDSVAHLAPAVQRAAGLPKEKRMALLRHDRWIGYPRARQVLDRLNDFLNWPARQRMPNGLIIGPTNNGKSMLIEKFRQSRMRRGVGSGRMDAETLPIMAVQTPSEPSVARFYSILLTAAGAPLRRACAQMSWSISVCGFCGRSEPAS